MVQETVQEMFRIAKEKLPSDVYRRVVVLRQPDDILEKRLEMLMSNGYFSSDGLKDALHIIDIFATNPPEAPPVNSIGKTDRETLAQLKRRDYSAFLGNSFFGELKQNVGSHD